MAAKKRVIHKAPLTIETCFKEEQYFADLEDNAPTLEDKERAHDWREFWLEVVTKLTILQLRDLEREVAMLPDEDVPDERQYEEG